MSYNFSRYVDKKYPILADITYAIREHVRYSLNIISVFSEEGCYISEYTSGSEWISPDVHLESIKSSLWPWWRKNLEMCGRDLSTLFEMMGGIP